MNDPFNSLYRNVCAFCWNTVQTDLWFSIQHHDVKNPRFIYFCDSQCMKGWRREKDVLDKIQKSNANTKLFRFPLCYRSHPATSEARSHPQLVRNGRVEPATKGGGHSRSAPFSESLVPEGAYYYRSAEPSSRPSGRTSLKSESV